MPRFMPLCILAVCFVATLNAGEAPRLGSLSEKYESGNRGPGTVSSGVGDPGGVSYGTYQLSSKLGRADQFVAKYFPEEFKGLKAGSDEFTKRWKQLAKEQTEKLREKEHSYIQLTHYDPQVAHLKKSLMLDVNDRSRALQNAVWSTAVQHGPNAKVIDRALAPLLKKQAIKELGDKEMLQAIYAERGRKDEQGVLVYFKNSSAAVQKGVAKRFENELRDALKALDAETQKQPKE
jgi:type VI secretion system (T6SS) spike protein VgrG3